MKEESKRIKWQLPKEWESFDINDPDWKPPHFRYEVLTDQVDKRSGEKIPSLILCIDQEKTLTNFLEVSLEVWLNDIEDHDLFHSFARVSYYGPGKREEAIRYCERLAIDSGLVRDRE